MPQALLPQGWREAVSVAVEDGVIRRLGFGIAEADAERLAGPVVPGLGNLHSHGFQRGMAGLAEHGGPAEDHFWTWREVMYRFVDRLQPADVAALTALAYAEMLESGFTAVAEFHYLHHDPSGAPYAERAVMAAAVAEAAAQTGIGLTLLPVFYRHGGFREAPASAGQRRFLSANLNDYAGLLEASKAVLRGLEDARLGLAPHSLRAVSAEDLKALPGLMAEGPIHLHAAEQQAEVTDCLAATGATPVRWLLDQLGLGPRWNLVHATHVDAAEVNDLAASGATAVLCPVTEANLGDGVFPALAYQAAGGRWGVGTDSNIQVSLAAELRSLEYSQRLRDRARNRLAPPGRSTGAALFAAAAGSSAQALGRSVGRIEVGWRADFVVLDANHPSLLHKSGDVLLDAWFFACVDSPLREVWVAGQREVVDGRHRLRDRIETAWRDRLRRLIA